MKKIKPSFLPAIGWFVICTVLLVLPGSAFPKENWLSEIWFDKWVHIGLFALLVTLCCWGALKKTHEQRLLRKHFIVFTILAIVYGTGMEFVQEHLVINRSFDNGDIAADAIGSVIGLLYSLGRYIKK